VAESEKSRKAPRLTSSISVSSDKITTMKTAIFKSSSKSDLDLLVKLAKKLGIEVSLLSNDEVEDKALSNAIRMGRTGKHIDTDTFLQDLKK